MTESALLSAIAAGTALGLAPAFHALSDEVMQVIRPGQRVTGGRTGMLRTGLLVMQVTLCTVLLIGAGLFLRSLAAGRAHDVGVDLNRVIEASLPPTLSRGDGDRLYALAMERLAVLPGVQNVALGGGSARLRTSRSRSMTPEGMTDADLQGRSLDAYFVVTPEYFATLGAQIQSGRDLTSADDQSRARVAVINRALGPPKKWCRLVAWRPIKSG
jgi:putative ABC transport system permease protein